MFAATRHPDPPQGGQAEAGFTMLLALVVIMALLMLGMSGVLMSSLNNVVAGHDRFSRTVEALADGAVRYGIADANSYIGTSLPRIPSFSVVATGAASDTLPAGYGFYSGHVNGDREQICVLTVGQLSCQQGESCGNRTGSEGNRVYRMVVNGIGPGGAQHEEEAYFVTGAGQ